MDLINIYKTFHPTAAQTFFSSAHKISPKIDYILGHKTSLNKFQQIASMKVSFFFFFNLVIILDIIYFYVIQVWPV